MKGRISHRERNDRNDECTEVLPIEDTHPESRIKMKIKGEGGKNIHHIQVRCLGGLKEIPKRSCQTKCPHHFLLFLCFWYHQRAPKSNLDGDSTSDA